MSWQCTKCETVNQDVTPVCTVCDSIAPVIETYLSLEAIELVSEYNEKLDVIHSLEVEERYDLMLDTAMEAIALYKQNTLALNKAKQALIHLNNTKLKSQISAMINNSLDDDNYFEASILLKISDSLAIDSSDYAVVRSEISNQLACHNEIEEILGQSYKATIELDTTQALQIVEEGLLKYPSNSVLQQRREDIKKLIISLNTFRKNDKRKIFPKAKSPVEESIMPPMVAEPEIIDLTPPRNRYPKSKRN